MTEVEKSAYRKEIKWLILALVGLLIGVIVCSLAFWPDQAILRLMTIFFRVALFSAGAAIFLVGCLVIYLVMQD